MQFPIADPLPPAKINKRNPHELHWRKEPPDWMGCCERSYQRHYPHLVDDPCCLQCGAVPCPYDHDEDRKIRLQDLEFVRELATDRKQLALQLRKLEEEIQGVFDRENEWKTQKLLLQQQVKDQEQLKKEWNRERLVLEGEISRLHSLNDKHQQQLAGHRKDQQTIFRLTKEVENLQQENEKLTEESEKFRRMVINQQSEINQLDRKTKVLECDLEESQTHALTLKVQLEESNESLQSVRDALWDKEAEMNKLNDAMSALIDELGQKTKLFEEKERESDSLIHELRDKVLHLTDTLENSEKMNYDLSQRVAELLAEIERLKQKLATDKRFRRFVDIKREVNDLKEQNETLLYKVKEQEPVIPLPVMKQNGRISATGSSVTLPNGRLSSAKLNRPKSSRSLRPTTPDDAAW